MRRIIKLLKDLTPDGRLVILTIMVLVVAIVILLALPAEADLPAGIDGEQEATSQAVEDVDAMILHLVKKYPRHPLNKRDWRKKMAEQVVIAANARNIPTDLVTAIIFRESSLRWDVIGPGGERGLMQCHPFTIRKFKCDMSTVAGQIECGCEVLAYHDDRCDMDLRAALAAYGSKTAECNPKPGSKLRAMVDDRFELADELQGVVEKGRVPLVASN